MYCFDVSIIVPWVEQEIDDEICGKDLRAIAQIGSDNQIIAAVVYSGFNGAQLVMSCVIKHPPSKKFFAMMFDYPFNRAPVNRLTAFIKANNEKSINLALRLGFVLESTLSQATLDADMHVFRLFKSECRFLNNNYAKALRG
jgi:hypothetical protein